MVPVLIVQSSVPLAVVVAVLPAELAHTEEGEGLMFGVAGLSLMVTLVIVQSSVPLAVVVAVLPAELPHTEEGEGLMFGVACLSVALPILLLLAEQFEALVTFRVSPTVPDAPAV